MEGLRKIVDLRGGIDSFRDYSKLLIEILRCDIGMALQSGSKPLFFNNLSSGESLPSYPNLTVLFCLPKPSTINLQIAPATFLKSINNDLAEAWKTMTDFSSLINFATESQHLIPINTLLDTMASVMYRLLALDFESGSLDEMVRLSLLAFSISVFLFWKKLGLSYTHLATAYKDCLAKLDCSQVSPELLLWFLMAGAVSILEPDDDKWVKPWIRVNIGLCRLESWDKMRELMFSFMWIDVVHNNPGKSLFESASQPR
ncbi:MAG: hypothetical protein Q9160_003613 [Pyrenula sp. 1 TL-2023]